MTGRSERSPESRTLHIHSGDSTADAARAAHIAGEHLPFRDALVDGPASPHLRPSYAAEQWGVDPDFVLCEQAAFHQSVRNGHDRIVCWFDRDLFCRVNFWFVMTQVPEGRDLWLAESHDPHRLDEQPRKLTAGEIREAQRAWTAYASDDPRSVEELVRSHSAFADPLRLHLSRFPSTLNGLGIVEKRLLKVAGAGRTAALDVVQQFVERYDDLGFGDLQIWSAMKRLGFARTPLISLSSDDLPTAEVQITSAGEDVLDGRADAVKLNGIDGWLGGVQLRGDETPWRWDGKKLLSF